jgi:hypothetical protein
MFTEEIHDFIALKYSDDAIAQEARKRYPYDDKENENRINKLSSKRRRFIEGAKFIRDSLLLEPWAL